VFHCAAPNARETPRLMLGKGVLERVAAHEDARATGDL
jgi:hypothetical protein